MLHSSSNSSIRSILFRISSRKVQITMPIRKIKWGLLVVSPWTVASQTPFEEMIRWLSFGSLLRSPCSSMLSLFICLPLCVIFCHHYTIIMALVLSLSRLLKLLFHCIFRKSLNFGKQLYEMSENKLLYLSCSSPVLFAT